MVKNLTVFWFFVLIIAVYCQYPIEISVWGASRHNSGRGYGGLATYPKPVYAKALNDAITNNAANSYIVDVAAGTDFSVAVDNLGNAWTFGTNYGGLGLGCTPTKQFGPFYVPQKLNVTNAGGNQVNVKKAMINVITTILAGANQNEYYIIGSFVDLEQSPSETVKTTKYCFPTQIDFSPILAANEIVQNIAHSASGIIVKTNAGKFWAMGSNMRGSLGLEQPKIYKNFTLLNFTSFLDPDVTTEKVISHTMSSVTDATFFLTDGGRLIVSGGESTFSTFKFINNGIIPSFDNDFTKFFVTSITQSADSIIITTYLKTNPTKTYYFFIGGAGVGPFYSASTPILLSFSAALQRELGEDTELTQSISLSSLTVKKIFTGKGFCVIFEKGVMLGSMKYGEGKFGANTFSSPDIDGYLGVRVPENLAKWFGVDAPENTKDIYNNLLKIELGETHALFLSDSGRVYTAGDNTKGQLGVGEEIIIETYNQPTTIQDFVPVNSSYFLKYATKNNLLRSPFKFAETAAQGESVAQIAAASDAFMVLTSIGRIFAWGKNNYGHLSLGHREFVAYPTEVDLSLFNLESGEKVIKVAISTKTSAVLTNLGNIYYVGTRSLDTSTQTSEIILKPRKIPSLWLKNIVERCSSSGIPAKIVDVFVSSYVDYHYFLFSDGIIGFAQISSYDPTATYISCFKTTYTQDAIAKIIGTQLYSFAILEKTGSLKVKNMDSINLVELLANVKDFSNYNKDFMAVGNDGFIQNQAFDYAALLGVKEMAQGVTMANGLKFVISTRGFLYGMGKNSYGQLGIGFKTIEEGSVVKVLTPAQHIVTSLVVAGSETVLATITRKSDDYWKYFESLDKVITTPFNILGFLTPFLITGILCGFFCCMICCIICFICLFCGAILGAFVLCNFVLVNLGFLGIVVSCIANCCCCCTFCVSKEGINTIGNTVKRLKRKSKMRSMQKKLHARETKKLNFSDPFMDNDQMDDEEDEIPNMNEQQDNSPPKNQANTAASSDGDEEQHEQIDLTNPKKTNSNTSSLKGHTKSPLAFEGAKILKFGPLATAEEAFGDPSAIPTITQTDTSSANNNNLTTPEFGNENNNVRTSSAAGNSKDIRIEEYDD